MPKPAQDHVDLLESLFRETALLYLRLRSAAEELHSEGPMTASLRSVLIELSTSGPMTVPDLARERPVARQYMFKIVQQLRQLGWVMLEPNPRHRRSYLVALTGAGRERVNAILMTERTALQGLSWPVSQDDLRCAVGVLGAVRGVIAANGGLGSKRREAP